MQPNTNSSTLWHGKGLLRNAHSQDEILGKASDRQDKGIGNVFFQHSFLQLWLIITVFFPIMS